MLRRLGSVLATLVALLVLVTAVGRTDDEPKRGRDLIMQQKLGSAQKVLEGLAIKDFNLIEKHADELGILSKRAEWLVLKTPEYTRHSDDFRRNAETMSRMAKEKNLDGAALAYVQLTMSCVNCHKYVREVRIARLDQ
jgi:cytochrome c556